MYVVLFLALAGIALMVAWRVASYVFDELRRFAGHPPRRHRRGRMVPISATHLPI
jgi:hypothetical protein